MWPTDELIVAEKKRATSQRDRLTRVHHEARAYRALQSMLNAAMAQSGRAGTELADYLKASPELAHWLSRWQAQSSAALACLGRLAGQTASFGHNSIRDGLAAFTPARSCPLA